MNSVSMDMDHTGAVKAVLDRISILEPVHIVKKAFGYIYMKEISDPDMIRLATGPDYLIHTFIQYVKAARILDLDPPLPFSYPMNPSPLQGSSLQLMPLPVSSALVGPISRPASFHKYLNIRGERNDPGPIVSDSRKIYLTFPAVSRFTEEDVSNYFSTYGPVQDVKIPCKQKRMFGFVTFASEEAVRLILSKRREHFVRGERLLVKPFQDKSKAVET